MKTRATIIIIILAVMQGLFRFKLATNPEALDNRNNIPNPMLAPKMYPDGYGGVSCPKLFERRIKYDIIIPPVTIPHCIKLNINLYKIVNTSILFDIYIGIYFYLNCNKQ